MSFHRGRGTSVTTARQEAVSRPIIVVGYQRSGTSLLAEMVHRWGAYVGPPDLLMQADEFNPQGYWEHTPLLAIFQSIANFAHYPFPTVTYFTIDQETVRRAAGVGSLRQPGEALITRMEEVSMPWMWKDPALVCFLPYWLELWKSPIFLVTVRDPRDSAVSWQEMILSGRDPNPAAVNAWLLQWQRCMTLIMANTQGYPRLFVEYERLLDEPGRQVGRIARFLDAHCTRPYGVAPDVEAMAATVTRRYAAHRASPWAAILARATRDQRQFYRDLQILAHDEADDGRFEERYPMAPGWVQLLRSHERAVLIERGLIRDYA
jgi:hypothetical protein